ncbi:hypothetical protein [Acanthopleuribacter pedis]|uniref:N-acetylmuramoyl-L-alanine amidase n=1 Tax=Acanthopleuribacter pedis TaxID=442870 RepID=A0A8J7QNN0_9BACT|nr:hypothetical protein [Acanthopleuribacter pedis]MBO1322445.1 hypothetical protein [Acanthopleuribacter pedis]
MNILLCSVLTTLLVAGGERLPFPDQPDIYLERFQKPDRPTRVFFLAPHENEQVVNDYLAKKVLKEGGCFLILRQRGQRHLFLKVGDAEYEVDPNRIFTPVGAESSLRRENPGLKEQPALLAQAVARAVAVGDFIKSHMNDLRRGSIIIAVHNNTDGFDDDGKGGVGTVSMVRYQKKLDTGAGYILKLHHGTHDEDDLFFITKKRDFKKLRRLGYNLVLQHPRVAVDPDEDDGSLSVLSEKRGLRYLNIEAQRREGCDHLDVQQKMVDQVFRLVRP